MLDIEYIFTKKELSFCHHNPVATLNKVYISGGAKF